MRWYMNDLSLQGQFEDGAAFLPVLSGIMAARGQFAILRTSLHTTRVLATRPVGPQLSLRELLRERRCRDIRGQVLYWLDRTGPFVEEDKLEEQEDFFEFEGVDVTETGLGEAARRTKFGEGAISYSFMGGECNYAITPLMVAHGLPEDRLGSYSLPNLWTVDGLRQSAMAAGPSPRNWVALIEVARERYPRLCIPDDVYAQSALAKEPFDAVVADRALALMTYLDEYMLGRNPDGSETGASRQVIETHFTGDRALFTGESESNRREFERALTFPDPEKEGAKIFAHWHGKISHRFFRMHFEWPVPPTNRQLKILYLGPKITKS
jgi:hypothetical protein